MGTRVGLGVAVAAGVPDELGDAEVFAVDEAEGDAEPDGLAEGLAVGDDVGLPDGSVGTSVGQLTSAGLIGVGDTLPVGLGVGVGTGVGVGVGVGVAVAVGEAPRLVDPEGEAAAAVVGAGVCVGLQVGSATCAVVPLPRTSRTTTASAPMRTVATKVTAPHSRRTAGVT